MPKMAGMVKPGPEEVAKAFRKIAKELGCDKSEERFRDMLFTLGTQKIADAPKPTPKPIPKRRYRIRQRTLSTKGSSD
jgi:hypothetical protein